jgi:hypothetical protein
VTFIRIKLRSRKHAGNFFPMPPHVPSGLRVPPPPVIVAELYPTSDAGTPIRRSYVVPIRWMVIYEYEVELV